MASPQDVPDEPDDSPGDPAGAGGPGEVGAEFAREVDQMDLEPSMGSGGTAHRQFRNTGQRTASSTGSRSLFDEECDFTWRQKLFLFLEEPDSSCGARVASYVLMGVIVFSIAAFVLQTVPSLADLLVWVVVDIASFAIFLLEYVLRFAVCNAFQDQTRWQFLRTPANVIDFLSLQPVFLMDGLEAAKPLRVLRAIKLVRLFRIFRLSKYSMGMNIMLESLLNSVRPLSILAFLLGICVMLFSSMVFHAEKLRCPDARRMSDLEFASYRAECEALMTGWSRENGLCCDRRGTPDDFQSIATAFWWATVTMTTVGYGDKVPRTFLGRAIGCLAMIAGIVLISLPVAIVGSKFQQAYHAIERQQRSQAAAQVDAQESTMQTPTAAAKTSPAQASMGAVQGTAFAQRPLQADLGSLKDKLKRLEDMGKLSFAGRSQVPLLLEMFDHLDRIDDRLAILRERDHALDMCIWKEVSQISRGYGRHVLQQSSAS